MIEVRVLHSGDVTPRVANGLAVRPTLGPQTGSELLLQAIVECPPGRSEEVSVGECEETLFVLEGSGAIEIDGRSHALEPETGVYLPPRTRFVLRADGAEPLRLLAVRLPDPSPGPPSPAMVRRTSDVEAEPATTGRAFRILADPESGLRSATAFIGEIPAERAPDHFHTYDEVIYVLEGSGVITAGAFSSMLSPGSCIQLPARTVHCVENTGPGPMRVLATLRPAGSPAAAFLPDGAPAY